MKVICPQCGKTHTSQKRRLTFRCFDCGAMWPNPEAEVRQSTAQEKRKYPGRPENLVPGAKYRKTQSDSEPNGKQERKTWEPPKQFRDETNVPTQQEGQKTHKKRGPKWWERQVF